ncbi:MAG TPA: UPF0149 family protein [Azospira sp.]|nr:UPF0149 family protein [Azospira sp.]
MNTAATPATPLADADLDRLEALLDDPALELTMDLDELQGYLCAALAGPVPTPEEQWLVEILGSEEAVASEAGQEAAALLRRFAAKQAELLASNEPLLLLLYGKEEGDDAPSDFKPWCIGFLHGVDGSPEDWFDAIDDEEELNWIDERLFPLMVLTGEAEAAAKEHGEEWVEGQELEDLERQCEDDLPVAVADMYRFWLAKRSGGTVRREGGKVGRNDPCPCGSGKKYKACCGATE